MKKTTTKIGAKVRNQRVVSVIDSAWLAWFQPQTIENSHPRDFFKEIPQILKNYNYQVMTVKRRKS